LGYRGTTPLAILASRGGILKMTATIKTMELIYADLLTPDQLMEEDLIKVDGDIVTVVGIESDSTGDIYYVGYEDDFGDKDVIEFNYNDKVELYVFRENSED
jgi:hypothetical protein